MRDPAFHGFTVPEGAPRERDGYKAWQIQSRCVPGSTAWWSARRRLSRPLRR